MTPRHTINRRDLLRQGSVLALGASAYSLLGSRLFAATTVDDKPHYFLHVIIPDGLDGSYLFDARPLAMTQAGLIANYSGEEPTIYTGVNGQSTRVTKSTAPLMKWKDHFSVVNGVVMSAAFDGHDQNMNVLLTGNPFGGETYLTWNNHERRPLDYVQTRQSLFANITSSGTHMNLSPAQCRELSRRVSGMTTASNPALKHLQARAAHVGQSKGVLAAASRRLSRAAEGVPDLAQRISSVKLTERTADQDNPRDRLLVDAKNDVEMMSELFRTGVSSTGVVILRSNNIDTHDQTSAKAMPTTASDLADATASIFEHLAQTPSADGRSMLDDTTVLIGSEFGRTMRQSYVSFADTGTDHNALTNTLLIGGKGVRGGLVVGESDFAAVDEVLSPAHLSLDPDKVKTMGRPFDHAGGVVVREQVMSAYDPYRYMTSLNVVNTVQELLGISADKRFTYGRNLPPAAVIPALIKG